MAFSNSDWIVKLHYAFQDAKNVNKFSYDRIENLILYLSLALYDYGLYARWGFNYTTYTL